MTVISSETVVAQNEITVTVFITPERLEELAKQARECKARAKLGDSLLFHCVADLGAQQNIKLAFVVAQ